MTDANSSNVSEVAVRGKKILVTGASRGLGAALVKEAIRRGADTVWAAARTRPSPSNAPSSGAEQPLTLDLADERSIESLADRIGQVDVLINNAAVARRGSLVEIPTALLREELAINYLGPVLLVRALVQRKKLRPGSWVINIASQLIDAPMPALANYCATKSALCSASRSLRAELRNHAIRVAIACPGAMATDMSAPFPGKNKQDPAAAAAEILDTCGSSEDLVPIGPSARTILAAMRTNSAEMDPIREQKLLLTASHLWPPAR